MTDQSGDAAPPALETKDLPFTGVPATVPYADSTHIDRGETGTVEEQPAVTVSPAGTADKTSDGDEKKTTTRRSSTSKDS